MTSREMKYEMQAVNTLFVRLGDVSSALSVWLGRARLHVDIARFATLNLALGGAWLFIALAMGRRHAALTTRS